MRILLLLSITACGQLDYQEPKKQEPLVLFQLTTGTYVFEGGTSSFGTVSLEVRATSYDLTRKLSRVYGEEYIMTETGRTNLAGRMYIKEKLFGPFVEKMGCEEPLEWGFQLDADGYTQDMFARIDCNGDISENFDTSLTQVDDVIVENFTWTDSLGTENFVTRIWRLQNNIK